MCYFKDIKFELYPEITRLHLGYKDEDETDQDWQKRAKLEKDMRDDLNRIRNVWKVVETPPVAKRKAAERQNDYQA